MMTAYDPKDRISAKKALEHSWIQQKIKSIRVTSKTKTFHAYYEHVATESEDSIYGCGIDESLPSPKTVAKKPGTCGHVRSSVTNMDRILQHKFMIQQIPTPRLAKALDSPRFPSNSNNFVPLDKKLDLKKEVLQKHLSLADEEIVDFGDCLPQVPYAMNFKKHPGLKSIMRDPMTARC